MNISSGTPGPPSGPNVANLPGEFGVPFFITYNLVEAEIKKHQAYTTSSSSTWLTELVKHFRAEYGKWGSAPDYVDYFQACHDQKLESKLLHLAVSTFLHVSYDLPRVLAENWPGVAKWKAAPSESDAEDAFFALSPIFPDAFRAVAVNKVVIGNYSHLARWFRGELTDAVIAVTAHWTMHLRTAAWIHAHRLHQLGAASSQFNAATLRMRQAMAAALIDVSDSKKWSAALLRPPHKPYPGIVVIPIAAMSREQVSAEALVIAGGLLGWLLVLALRRRKKEEAELIEFINTLGRRVLDYTDKAIRDPQGFSQLMSDRERHIEPHD